MNLILDLLGALIIASILMLMLITFQFQLTDIANRSIFSAQMFSHEQRACADLNRLVALVGIGVSPDSVVTQADAGAVTFRTRWNYTTNTLMVAPQTLQLTVESATSVGRQLRLVQGGTVLTELGYILWLEDLSFRYFDVDNAEITIPTTATTRQNIRSMDVRMTFRRDPPRVNAIPLRMRVQLRIYFMNSYLQGA